jgi:hypothetical protein
MARSFVGIYEEIVPTNFAAARGFPRTETDKFRNISDSY